MHMLRDDGRISCRYRTSFKLLIVYTAALALFVPDYDDALAFYVGTLGFDLVEDTVLSPEKRWVLVAPPGARECRILLAKAASDMQTRAIGNQTGGRVFLFLSTDDFDRDHERMLRAGVQFLEPPRTETHGKVAQFRDPYGSKWDLVEYRR